MDQVKIGKFIAELRKSRNMTQEQLGQKIGVSFKTISKWENGRGLPELSLLKPLSEELNISINELLSGERVGKENYLNRLEENMLSTFEYSKEQKEKRENILSIGVLVLGIIIIVSAIIIFPSESSWGVIYSVIGTIISSIGFANLIRKIGNVKRIALSMVYFIICIVLLILLDFVNVMKNDVPPRFSLSTTIKDKAIEYITPMCNVFRINFNTKNEYYIIDTKKAYNIDTIPKSPFNVKRAGIENIIKYKTKYVGNNSNVGNLISNLPLSEYGYVFEIDSDKYGIIIDYHITDWYINDSLYLERALIYNSVALFTLVDNINYIKYNFTGNSYMINRDTLKEFYPNYLEIVDNGNIVQDKFNLYVLNRMNEDKFVETYFRYLFKK